MMDAIACLRTRRSVRRFDRREVPADLIREAVQAAALAPTARNVQPWEFVAVTDPVRLAQIGQATDHGKFIENAPCCIAVLCRDTKYFLEDGAAAATTCLLALHALGLAACWVAGEKKPYTAEILQILSAPPEHKLIALIPCGYPLSELPAPPKRSESEFLHWQTFR